MCDTMVAVPAATKNGQTLFAKNSDREPDEPQHIVRIDGATHLTGSLMRTTYMTIPQVRRTSAIVMSRPSWLWGGEIGCNEFGVAIGNEAVFTREKVGETGLTGMDLLRLGLERSQSARGALDVITEQMKVWQQGGLCGYRDRRFKYSSSFIIADPSEAWILETAGQHWAARKVEYTASISNRLTIGEDFDLHSPGLLHYAISKGYTGKHAKFNFAKAFSDRFYSYFSRAGERQKTTFNSLCGEEALSVEDMFKSLRTHEHQRGEFDPARATMRSVCMHPRGLLTPSQTTGSYVGVLDRQFSTHWFTGTSAPCLSSFKPFYFPGMTRLEHNFDGDDINDMWWRHEKLHRLAMKNYSLGHEIIAPDRDRFESELLSRDSAIRSILHKDRERALATADRLTREALHESNRLTDEATARLQEELQGRPVSRYYKRYWAGMARKTHTVAVEREHGG